MRLPHLLIASALGAALATGGPALAQYKEREPPPGTTQPPPPRTSGEPVDEIIVTPRNVPSYEEYDEFQRAEFEKIRARFEKPPEIEPRGDQALSAEELKSPEDRVEARSLVRQAPRLRDLGKD